MITTMKPTDRSRPPSAARRLLAAATLVVLAATAGCASIGDARLEQEARARAEQRWQHLIRRDFDAAYAMNSPGWRGLNPLPEWRASFGTTLQWLSAEATHAKCDGSPLERCTVFVRVRSQITGMPFKDVPRDGEVSEDWIRQDGQWWHVPRAQ